MWGGRGLCKGVDQGCHRLIDGAGGGEQCVDSGGSDRDGRVECSCQIAQETDRVVVVEIERKPGQQAARLGRVICGESCGGLQVESISHPVAEERGFAVAGGCCDQVDLRVLPLVQPPYESVAFDQKLCMGGRVEFGL